MPQRASDITETTLTKRQATRQFPGVLRCGPGFFRLASGQQSRRKVRPWRLEVRREVDGRSRARDGDVITSAVIGRLDHAMRYSAMNQDGDIISRYEDFVPLGAFPLMLGKVPENPAKYTSGRYSDEQLYALAVYLYSLRPPA